ncbi:VOC family protein [Streptomyces sp. NPDC048305]|uniref:VOC family protein n=1 Tax=Streptomyces sp. NPDC048305 TaxID=3365532 RepID=UPI00371708AD
MIAKLQCVVLDCADPVELSRFYQSLLGGTVNLPDPRWSLDEGWATLHTDGLVLAFQRVEDHRPPSWGDPARPQQLHLDLGVEDLDRAQRTALGLGASLLDEGEGRRSWRILADPAGHPFCLVRDRQEVPWPQRDGAGDRER